MSVFDRFMPITIVDHQGQWPIASEQGHRPSAGQVYAGAEVDVEASALRHILSRSSAVKSRNLFNDNGVITCQLRQSSPPIVEYMVGSLLAIWPPTLNDHILNIPSF